VRGLIDRLRGKETEANATRPASSPQSRTESDPQAQRRPRPAGPGAAQAQAPNPSAQRAQAPNPPTGKAQPMSKPSAPPVPAATEFGGSGEVDDLPAVAGKGKVREASREFVAELMNYKGEVLTAHGGPAEIPQSQQQFVAMLDNRLLIVSKSHAMHHDVSSVRSLLRRKGIVWRLEYHVDLPVIRAIYSTAEKRTGGISPNRVDAVTMQREFLKLLEEAASRRASDIHVVVHRYEAMIEIRVDGTLGKFNELTASTALELCQAAFAMSDVSDPTYMPMEQQGSRVTEASLKGLKFPEGVQSVRLQFSPLPNGGRYMVARLLYENKADPDADVDVLGYCPEQIAQIREMRKRPFGLNIISGPTGSGKSTTLQRCMIALMRERPGINTVTIEDPPEYVIPGAKQIPVSNASTAEERREKFRQAITGALRLDPDIIMVGEIRDGVSAHLGFEAAMSGHGLWASLHTNDAISILDRLRDMGTEIYKLADASLVTGLIGQRLVRKNHPQRSVGFEEAVRKGYCDERTEKALRELLPADRLAMVRFGDTARLADNSKFQGRTVVAETILPDQHFLNLWKDSKKPEAVAYWQNNLRGITMLEHVFVKVANGLVDPREAQDKIGMLEKVDPKRVEWLFEVHG